jgi:hypothetical protein
VDISSVSVTPKGSIHFHIISIVRITKIPDSSFFYSGLLTYIAPMYRFLILLIIPHTFLFGQQEIVISALTWGTSPIYRIQEPSRGDLLNRTRKQAGSLPVIRSTDLDSLALNRCLRMVRILESNPISILKTHGREAHNESTTQENAGAKVYATPYFPDRLGRPSPEEIKSLYATRVGEFREKPSGSFYDDSPGHSRNRTDPRWREFGEASVLVLLRTRKSPDDPNLWAPDMSVKMVWLNYEVFR